MIREVKRKIVPTEAKIPTDAKVPTEAVLLTRARGTEPDLLGRIVVAAGIFLLLFLTGHFLHEPSQETVRAWVSSDAAYETAVENTAAWLEQRLEQRDEAEEKEEH